MTLSATPAELARESYRLDVIDRLSRSQLPLSDAAALAVDVLAATPQTVMSTPRALTARAYFDVHAEEHGMPAFTRESLQAALEELADRGLLPHWCKLDRTVSEVTAR